MGLEIPTFQSRTPWGGFPRGKASSFGKRRRRARISDPAGQGKPDNFPRGKAFLDWGGGCLFPRGRLRTQALSSRMYPNRRVGLPGLLGAASLLGGRDGKGRLPERVEIEDGHWDHP
jgi:hypothetical protein